MIYWLEANMTPNVYFYCGVCSTIAMLLRLLLIGQGAGSEPKPPVVHAAWLITVFGAGFGWMGLQYSFTGILAADLQFFGALGFGCMMTLLGWVGIQTAYRYHHGKPEEPAKKEPATGSGADEAERTDRDQPAQSDVPAT